MPVPRENSDKTAGSISSGCNFNGRSRGCQLLNVGSIPTIRSRRAFSGVTSYVTCSGNGRGDSPATCGHEVVVA